MPRAVITFAGLMSQPQNSGDLHPFVPCLEAKQGDELLLRAWVRLTWEASETAKSDLLRLAMSVDEAYARINRALMLYGVRRMHRVVSDHLSTNTQPDSSTDYWDLKVDDVTALLQSTEGKSCSFQVKHGRNLFCAAAGINDPTVSRELDGQRVAPTSTPLCGACSLPDDDYLCSSLMHPQVLGMVGSGMGPIRKFEGALCDKGQLRNIQTPHRCLATGHSCWHKTIDVETPSVAPVSPLELAEAWDVLDAVWRLVFGKNKRLLRGRLGMDCGHKSLLRPTAFGLICTLHVPSRPSGCRPACPFDPVLGTGFRLVWRWGGSSQLMGSFQAFQAVQVGDEYDKAHQNTHRKSMSNAHLEGIYLWLMSICALWGRRLSGYFVL